MDKKEGMQPHAKGQREKPLYEVPVGFKFVRRSCKCLEIGAILCGHVRSVGEAPPLGKTADFSYAHMRTHHARGPLFSVALRQPVQFRTRYDIRFPHQ
jgi:hypothetical protein